MSFDFHHLQKPSIGFKSVQGALQLWQDLIYNLS